MRSLAKALVAVSFAVAVFAITTDASAHRRGRHKPKPSVTRPGPAIPEPTGALAFAAGLLALNAATRRRAARQDVAR